VPNSSADILVVEWSDLITEVLKHKLSMAGFSVEAISELDDAPDKLIKGTYKVVIVGRMDCWLGDCPGATPRVITILRKLAKPDTAFISLSTEAARVQRDADETGADAVVLLPKDIGRLEEIVGAVIGSAD
jgi:DNA-binding response OmpR family regulator